MIFFSVWRVILICIETRFDCCDDVLEEGNESGLIFKFCEGGGGEN